MTKVFYAINISGNVIDLGFTMRYLVVYNKKLEQTTLCIYMLNLLEYTYNLFEITKLSTTFY